jgi:hypothetical protein
VRIAIPYVQELKEIPQLVAQYPQRLKDQDITISRVKEEIGDEEIFPTLTSIRQEHQEMKTVFDVLPNSTPSALAKDIDSLKRKCDELEDHKGQVLQIIKVNILRNY